MRDSRDRAGPLDFPSQSSAGHRWSWWQWCCVSLSPECHSLQGRTSWWGNPGRTEMVKSVQLSFINFGKCVVVLFHSVMSDSLATPWAVVHEFHYPWISVARILSGLTFPSPGDFPNSGIEPVSPSLYLWSRNRMWILLQLNHWGSHPTNVFDNMDLNNASLRAMKKGAFPSNREEM